MQRRRLGRWTGTDAELLALADRDASALAEVGATALDVFLASLRERDRRLGIAGYDKTAAPRRAERGLARP